MIQLLHADARWIPLADESVQCVVTSPPYWGLRDYGVELSVWDGDPDCAHEWGEEATREGFTGKSRWQHTNAEAEPSETATTMRRDTKPEAWGQVSQGAFCEKCGAWRGCLGLEPTHTLYALHMVAIFRDVRRVLKPDGVCWLNLGDSYTSGGRIGHGTRVGYKQQANRGMNVITAPQRTPQPPDLKPKDLVGIPWRVAFALQADGWWLRSDIIWAKPNPMPESVRDRPTVSHEYVFLLAKSGRYFYDADAIRERATTPPDRRATKNGKNPMRGQEAIRPRGNLEAAEDPEARYYGADGGRNARTVWTIATTPFPEAHFATFPVELARRCVLAGSKAGDLVCDPFSGSGTVGLVCEQLGRSYIGLDLKPDYHDMAQRRIAGAQKELFR